MSGTPLPSLQPVCAADNLQLSRNAGQTHHVWWWSNPLAACPPDCYVVKGRPATRAKHRDCSDHEGLQRRASVLLIWDCKPCNGLDLDGTNMSSCASCSPRAPCDTITRCMACKRICIMQHATSLSAIRLIRLPGSLHRGKHSAASSLQATSLASCITAGRGMPVWRTWRHAD